MKKLKFRFTVVVMTLLMSFMALPVSASVTDYREFYSEAYREVQLSEISHNGIYVHIWGEIFIPAHQEYVWEQLLVDIALLNSVGIYDEERFAIENQIWIRELNARLDSFLQSVPSEHHYHLMVFLTGGHPLSRNDQMSNFFTKYLRHNRGGFVTYTLRPTFSTRVLHHMSEKGWGGFQWSIWFDEDV